MSIDREAVAAMAAEKMADKAVFDEIGEDVESQGLSVDFSFLLAKTGEGSIDEYIDHPLNFKNTRGVAQIIRGATGFAGDLDLALIDIGLGIINCIREGAAHGTGQQS